MSSRKSKWIIYETSTGWDLSRGGRYLYNDLRSKQEILQRLKNHHRPGESVMIEEKDGHRINITKQLQKAGLIS